MRDSFRSVCLNHNNSDLSRYERPLGTSVTRIRRISCGASYGTGSMLNSTGKPLLNRRTMMTSVSLCKLSGVELCTLFGVREPAAAQSQGGNVFTTGDPTLPRAP